MLSFAHCCLSHETAFQHWVQDLWTTLEVKLRDKPSDIILPIEVNYTFFFLFETAGAIHLILFLNIFFEHVISFFPC